MKSYAIKTAKKLSHDADFTLQETLKFRNSIGSSFNQSAGLKTQLDGLSGTLENLRESNARLASNQSTDDLELYRKIEQLKQQCTEQSSQLREESDSLVKLEESMAVFDDKLAKLHSIGQRQMQEIISRLALYSEYLGLAIEKLGSEFKVTFKDLDEFVMIRVTELTKLSISGLPEVIESDINDPLAVCKILTKARNILKP